MFDEWQANAQSRQRTANKLTNKALGLGDDMNIQTGIGWKELAVIGAMLVGCCYWLQPQQPPPVPAPMPAPVVVQVPVAAPVATDRTETVTKVEEMDLHIYDQDGTPIIVKPWPGGE